MSPQIVYYYFKTMDDLFEALFLRIADYFVSSLGAAAASADPVVAMWA